MLVDLRRAHSSEGRATDVARQRARGKWTARERVDSLLDAESFSESGQFAEPMSRGLVAPSDGVITGLGTVNGRAVAVAAYDYAVLGGSQGQISHRKLEHLFASAARERCPVVLFAEGGGARVQELEPVPGGGTSSFVALARLSSVVPLAAAVTGPAFAGHANLAGLCDLVIATSDATMGIGGPPLVEAASGMTLTPAEIGPMSVHQRSGAVDIVVEDDAEVLASLRRWLRLVQPRPRPSAGTYVRKPDPALRKAVPSNPRQAYDVRAVIDAVADEGTVLEVRPRFAPNVITSFIEIGERPLAVVANQPMRLAGSIDSNGSDKMARFIQLADAIDVPIIFLVDTPGFMVGPQAEERALVRHSARVLQRLGDATVPIVTVVLRKAYGLAYYAMGSPPFGSAHTMAWPSAEFGGMGLAGAANIAQRGQPRQDESHDQHVADLRGDHTVWRVAARYAVDEIIDPADTRDAIHRVLSRHTSSMTGHCIKRHAVDAW